MMENVFWSCNWQKNTKLSRSRAYFKIGQKLIVGHLGLDKTCDNPAAKRPRIWAAKRPFMRVLNNTNIYSLKFNINFIEKFLKIYGTIFVVLQCLKFELLDVMTVVSKRYSCLKGDLLCFVAQFSEFLIWYFLQF